MVKIGYIKIVNCVIMGGLNMNSLLVWGEIYNRLKILYELWG